MTKSEKPRRLQAYVTEEFYREVLLYAIDKNFSMGDVVEHLIHRGLAVEGYPGGGAGHMLREDQAAYGATAAAL